jgi:hypothetical protein
MHKRIVIVAAVLVSATHAKPDCVCQCVNGQSLPICQNYYDQGAASRAGGVSQINLSISISAAAHLAHG